MEKYVIVDYIDVCSWHDRYVVCAVVPFWLAEQNWFRHHKTVKTLPYANRKPWCSAYTGSKRSALLFSSQRGKTFFFL